MGLRIDSWIGLNRWALEFTKGEEILAYTEVVTRYYQSGSSDTLPRRDVMISSVKKSAYSTYKGGSSDHPLMKYVFPDGKTYYEEVQTEKWTSGCLIFVALMNNPPHEGGEWVSESRWNDREMKQYA